MNIRIINAALFALLLTSVSCGHKAEPKYCSQQFGSDAQALLDAGKVAREHWEELPGSPEDKLKKLKPEKIRPYKKQCDQFFSKYSATMTCVNPMGGEIINAQQFKEGCDFAAKALAEKETQANSRP